jgi:hypothetical protein
MRGVHQGLRAKGTGRKVTLNAVRCGQSQMWESFHFQKEQAGTVMG